MAHKEIAFREIEGSSPGYYVLFGLFGLLVLGALAASWYMEHQGHWVTGMSNQVVWGVPHVFAVFLIVAASGALNVASISSVFEVKDYKPLAPLSALLSMALLTGGLAVLVLDLGRPDRLVVAMTSYNFKSIFAWNIYLYTGFFAVVGIYTWVMMDERFVQYKTVAGFFAMLWRIMLTTGTGSIFGFLVARQAYDEALYPPMFIIMSFAYGLAIYLLVIMALYNGTGRPLGDYLVFRMRNLLKVFVGAVLYFTVVQHLTNLYATEHHGVESFILLNGGPCTALFWIGQVLMGSLIPLAILFSPKATSRKWTATAASLIVFGGICQVYVIIIGGQTYPLVLFPGMEVTSSFYDGVIYRYLNSFPELALGLGGIGLVMAIVMLAVKVLPFLPKSLEDEFIDPEYAARQKAAAATAGDDD